MHNLFAFAVSLLITFTARVNGQCTALNCEDVPSGSDEDILRRLEELNQRLQLMNERMNAAVGQQNSQERSSQSTCNTIKEQQPNASSGTYSIVANSGKLLQVYCEMGLNGGGYTFLHPTALSIINDLDISQMFTDNTTFLLRARRTDGTQPYAVLRQLPEFSYVPLKIGISSCESYAGPGNAINIGSPYIFFGFLPSQVASVSTTQGLEVNGVRVSYTRCGVETGNYIALFPNFKEADPESAYYPDPVYAGIFSNVRDNPSGRVMPCDYFLFGEIHFAECGCYVQTNQMKNDKGVLALAIGFR